MPPLLDRRSEPALLARIARTLFTHDAAGRIIDVNEPDGARAPRCYLAWNDHGVIWRVRNDVPAAVADRIAAIVAAQPASGDLAQPLACTAAICAALAEHAPVAAAAAAADGRDGAHDGSIEYAFPEPHDPQRPPDPRDAPRAGDTAIMAVTADTAGALARWLPSWQSYAATSGLPLLAAIVDGAAVSVCACVRFPGDATEAGVETHAAFRGRGHAVAVTAAWARAVRARGIFPLYSASWSNTASHRVAAKLGLVPIAGSLSIA